MHIDWPTKRLKISDEGLDVYLQGTGAKTEVCHSISVEQLSGLHRHGEIEQLLVVR